MMGKYKVKYFIIIFWILIFPVALYFFDKYIPVNISLNLLILLFFIALLLYAIYVYSNKKIRIFIIGLLIISIIPSFFIISAFSITNTIYHRSDFDVIFTTDLDESLEFIHQFVNFKIIMLLIAYFGPMPLFFKMKDIQMELNNNKRKLIVMGSFLVLILIFTVNWKLLQGEYHVVDFYKSYYQFINNKNYEIIKAKRADLKWEDKVTCDLKIREHKLYVLVIGESLTRAHMQIYGYQRETNPQLIKIKDELYIFNNVISPAVTTVDVMKYVLSFANLDHPEYFIEKRNVVNLFNDVGFETIWIGNQSLRGNRNNVSHSIVARECNQYYDVSSETDEVVINKLDTVLTDEPHKNLFIIIHLRGCHTKYSSRYSDIFNYFNHKKIPIPYDYGLDDKQKLIIDEYDNSVRFNDYIIYSIIKRVKSHCKYAWVVYFSDHGEELFEFRNMFGHNSRNFSKYMCEIPFIVWVSNEYKNANKSFFEDIPKYLNRAYSTENVIYSIADLSKLKFTDFDASLSIFSKQYTNHLRKVYNIEYEKIPPITTLNGFK